MEQFLSKHSVKVQITTAIIVILSVIAWTNKATKTYSDLENDCLATREMAENNALVVEKLDIDARKRDLTLVEIKTKLTTIESLLAEIRQKIK